MDHQTKNKEHKQLVQDMELGLKRVMLVGGVAQRLLGKVAIVTGMTLCKEYQAHSLLLLQRKTVPTPHAVMSCWSL